MQSYVLMLQADEDDQYLTQELLAEMQESIPIHFIDAMDTLDGCIKEFGLPAVILINNLDHRHKAIHNIGYAKKNPAIPRLLVPGCRSASANKISGVLFYY